MSERKTFINDLYHSTVVASLAVGYARLTKMVLKQPTIKLDFNLQDMGMLIMNLGMAMATKDLLVKQGIIPENIMK